MRVYILNREKEIEIKARTVKELLRKLGYAEFEVLVIDKKRRRLLTPDLSLNDVEEIEIREVIGG